MENKEEEKAEAVQEAFKRTGTNSFGSTKKKEVQRFPGKEGKETKADKRRKTRTTLGSISSSEASPSVLGPSSTAHKVFGIPLGGHLAIFFDF